MRLLAELKQRSSGSGSGSGSIGGVSRGEADLIESPAKVRATLRAARQRMAESHGRMQSRITETHQTIARLFGEFLAGEDAGSDRPRDRR